MKRAIIFGAALALAGALTAAEPERVSIAVDPGQVLNRVDEKIYGHFLEHIFHSVNGGLWGELVWDRSFEGGAIATPAWSVKEGCLVQSGGGTNVRNVFGDPQWRDYEFSLEAQKTGGAEGFLILFRVVDEKQFYWANLGGWQNERHGLERGIKGQTRWGTIGPVQPGKIESKKWCRIRARCEGPRLQVWLDDERVIDFTDDAEAHLTGRVGVGTWSTQARFRNLKVAALDGKTLFEGLPEVEAAEAPAHAWTKYGPGEAAPVDDDALNGDRCKLLETDGGETGLEQAPLRVLPGATYSGSVWVRGEAPSGLVVRLRDGAKTLAESMLAKPTQEWQEYNFLLKPEAAAEGATLQVGLRGAGKVRIDQVSLLPGTSRGTGGFRPDLLQAVADLKPPIIRWPGGCYASQYFWKGGVGPQHTRVKYPTSIWGDVDVNSYGTDEFIRMCRAIDSEPVIVINVGMHDAREKRGQYCQDACDWVEYCNGPVTSKWGAARAANGHAEPYQIKYWEIDNEIWRLEPDDYVSVLKQFVPAMKKVDPSIITIACGSGQLGRNWGAGDRAVIEQAAELVDFLSVHHYEGANRFAEGPAAAETFWRGLADQIARSKNPKMKLYVSEWNAQSTDWRTGLYCGGILNVFERCGDSIELAGPALFLRHASARSWDNAFINFDHRGWFPAPNYVVMKLWREHYAPLRVKADGAAGSLNHVATKTQDGRTLYFKAVNPSERPAPVELKIASGFKVKRATLQLVTAAALDARNTLDDPHRIKPQTGKAEVRGNTIRFDLPRWSAAVVTIQQ